MTQTLTTERQKFEEWFVGKYKQPERLVKTNEGEYKFSGVQMAFDAFHDSRELLANREAQPVLYASEETLAYAKEGEKSLVTWSEPMGDAVIPLFTAPPAPAVPETAHSSVIAEQLAHVLSGMDVTGHHRAVISCAVDRLNKNAELIQQKQSSLNTPEVLDYQGAKELFNYLMTEEETNATVNGWNACRAAMLAQPVSSGYKLVPVEPTAEMISSAMGIPETAIAIYKRMLAAAPEGGNG